MPTISAQELTDLVRPIVESEMQDEKLAFDLTAVAMADEMLKNRAAAKVREAPDSFGFLGAKEAGDVLEYVKLLGGTLAFLTASAELLKIRRTSPPNLEEFFEDYLRKSGLSKRKSSHIARCFCNHIVSWIERPRR